MMQDTTLFEQSNQFQDQMSHIVPDNQNFFQQMFSAEITRTPMKNFYSLNLPAPARKILETVLLNLNMMKIPASKEDYREMMEGVIQDKNLQDKNVAVILRSMADQVKYDRCLQTIYIKQLGFQQETRIFQNERIHSSQPAEQEVSSQGQSIGYVRLLDFLLLFGIQYALFSPQDSQTYRSKLSQQVQANDESLNSQQYLTGIDEYIQQSLLTPPMSQIADLARKSESEPIIQVFQETQIKKLQESPQEKLQQMQECDEILMANENLQIQDKHRDYEMRHMQNIKIESESQIGPLNSSLSVMLHNLNTKSITSQGYKAPNPFQYQNQNEKVKDKIFLHTPFNSGFKPYNEPSLISANNSIFATPVKPRKESESYLYPNNSELKPKPNSVQNLFSSFTQQMTPAQISNNFVKKEQFPNQKSLFQSNQKQSLTLFGKIGTKRLGKNSDFLQKMVSQEKDITMLTRRQRLEVTAKNNSNKEEKKHEESDDENQINGDIASSASRKKRGLKILSVKVQELVFKKKSTTYKDVANELIKQLRESKSEIDLLEGMDDSIGGFGDEDDEMSDDSPKKKSHVKDSGELQQKWEKNVRRRVYDALNVLYAAGVLQKHGKHVSCDSNILQMT